MQLYVIALLRVGGYAWLAAPAWVTAHPAVSAGVISLLNKDIDEDHCSVTDASLDDWYRATIALMRGELLIYIYMVHSLAFPPPPFLLPQ